MRRAHLATWALLTAIVIPVFLVLSMVASRRQAALGGKGLQAAAAKTTLAPYPLNLVRGRDHVEALGSALAAYGGIIRKAIDQADQLGDKGTADLFTEISRGIDKALWMVEAHHQVE